MGIRSVTSCLRTTTTRGSLPPPRVFTMAAAVPAVPAAAPSEWDATNKSAKDIARERLLFSQSLSEEEMRLRNAGLYFTSMEDLWGNDDLLEFGQANFDAIIRTTAQGKLYEACYTHLDQEIRGADARSATTNQRGNAIRLDTFGNTYCQSAHLLSHAALCHKAYGFLAEAAIGMSFGQPTATGRRTRSGRRIRNVARLGASPEDPPHVKRLKILAGVNNYNGSSLKSHKFNKVYLREQGTYYDTDDPSILIPLLTLQQVMDWATDATSAIEYDVMAVTFGDKSAVASANLAYALQECTPTEIEEGRRILVTFVLGLAGSVKTRAVRESFTQDELRSRALSRWSSLVDNILDGTVTRIGVPEPSQAGAAVHVAKGRMSLRTSLPDPWLLMLKAAINYSAFRGTTLMPACPPEEEDDGPPNTIQGMEMEQPQDSLLAESMQRVSCLFTDRPSLQFVVATIKSWSVAL